MATSSRDPEDYSKPQELRASRTDLKRERVADEKALAQLAKELVALPLATLERIGVPEEAVDSVLDAQKIKSFGALERQLRHTRKTLRDADWATIRRNLDLVKAGLALPASSAPAEPGEGPSLEEQVRKWTDRLLVQGDSGIGEFIEIHPEADRNRLRQVVRTTRSVPEQKRAKARLNLERLVRGIIEQAS